MLLRCRETVYARPMSLGWPGWMSRGALLVGACSLFACGSSRLQPEGEPRSSAIAPTPAPTAEAGKAERPRPAADAATTKDAAGCQAMLGTPAARSNTTVTAAPGAGGSERFEGIIAAVKDHRGALRCCYDLWARENPGADARVTLSFELDQGGAVARILLKGDAEKLTNDARTCLIDVATAIPYPASRTGKLTTFEYDLGFKHR